MRYPILTVLLLAVLIWVQPAASQEGETIVFRFAPQDGERWIEEMEDLREYGDVGDRSTWKQEISQKDTLIFHVAEDGAPGLTRVMGPAEMRVDGNPHENPILDTSEGTRLEFELDENGRASSVEGYRRLMRRLERKLSPEAWEKLLESYSMSDAERAEIGRWNDRLAGLIGLEVRPGEVLAYSDVYPTTAGPTRIRGTMSFEGFTEIDGQRGFTVRYAFGGGSLAPSLDGREPRALNIPRAGEAAPSDFDLEGSRVRVIVPESGHMIYEHTEVHWTEIRPGGQPPLQVRLQTVYRLHPAPSPD